MNIDKRKILIIFIIVMIIIDVIFIFFIVIIFILSFLFKYSDKGYEIEPSHYPIIFSRESEEPNPLIIDDDGRINVKNRNIDDPAYYKIVFSTDKKILNLKSMYYIEKRLDYLIDLNKKNKKNKNFEKKYNNEICGLIESLEKSKSNVTKGLIYDNNKWKRKYKKKNKDICKIH